MVTVGIVGGGLRGRLFAGALADFPAAQVVGIAEPSAAAADAAGVVTGLPVVSSQDELLATYDPDAIIVATPDFAHREAAVTAANAGKHLLIEKPLATTAGDAAAIASAVRRGGSTCLVGFENRWNPHCLRSKEIVDSGQLGDPITMTAALSNSYAVPTEMLSWAAQSSPAWFLMPHTVDLALWLTDAAPVSVYAVASRGVLADRGIDTWDVVHALITLAGGRTVNLSSSWVLPDSSEGIVDFTYSLTGTAGSVRADLGHQGLVATTDAYRSLQPMSGAVGGSPVGAPTWMVRDWVSGLAAGSSIGPGLDQGLLVTAVICAIEQSIADGGTVSIAIP